MLLMISACSSAPTVAAPTVAAPTVAAPTVAAPTVAAPTVAAPTESEISEKEFEDFDPKNFDRSTNIDNEWFPLKPGMQFVYEGSTVENDERIPHRVVFTVTDMTKVINNVRAVVIFDRDYSDDQLEEAELTFFAQDNDGNVWHLGQYRETYDGVEFVGGRVWLVGYLEGARAGIMMQAEPRLETPSYSEGYAPAPFYWTDRARVYQMGQKTRVPFGSYEGVLVTEEFNQEKPGAFQLKYYVRGVGNVRVGWRGDDASQEELELVDVVQLDPAGLAQIRAEALELEKRAYIYGLTPPAEHIPPDQ
jgi:hypothetical protein